MNKTIAKTTNGWVSVNDLLPEIIDGCSNNVIATVKGRNFLYIMAYCVIDSWPQWCNCNRDIAGDPENDDDYEVTHWMPLPSLPRKLGRCRNTGLECNSSECSATLCMAQIKYPITTPAILTNYGCISPNFAGGKPMREVKFRAWDNNGSYMTISFTLVDAILQRPFKDEVKNRIYTQFTGLTDIEGNEIYEGDIMGDGVVTWMPDDGQFLLLSNLWQHSMRYACHTYKVTGNIFENPELINYKNFD